MYEGRKASAAAQLLTTSKLRRNAKVLALRTVGENNRWTHLTDLVGRKASATAELLTDGRTDTISQGSELGSFRYLVPQPHPE